MSIDGSQLSLDGRGSFDNRSFDGSRSFDGGRSSIGGQSALNLSLDLRSFDGRSATGRSQDMDSDWDSAGSVSSMGVNDGGSPRSLHSLIGSAVSVPLNLQHWSPTDSRGNSSSASESHSDRGRGAVADCTNRGSGTSNTARPRRNSFKGLN
eukprot:SAG31_NODE_25715_length_456_cov_0.577031_1_plen_151_part_11